jgi:hypothetical protein
MKDYIHTRVRNAASISTLLTALVKNFPLFRAAPCEKVVDESGNHERGRNFLMLRSFSTNFPHKAVDGNA